MLYLEVIFLYGNVLLCRCFLRLNGLTYALDRVINLYCHAKMLVVFTKVCRIRMIKCRDVNRWFLFGFSTSQQPACIAISGMTLHRKRDY